MARAVDLWIGKTDDTPIPDRVRIRVFIKHDGYCAKCTRKLRPGHWACDHIVSLINGGRNAEDNLQPLCISPCHKSKTQTDVREKAKVAYVQKRHLGVKKPRRITRWRKFNGGIVIAKRDR